MTTPKIDGYEPFRVEPLRAKAKLPGTVWRVLSVAARPDPHCDVRPAFVDDTGTTAVVLTAEHYTAMLERLRDLEQWASEQDTNP